jgi:hypothetical protein
MSISAMRGDYLLKFFQIIGLLGQVVGMNFFNRAIGNLNHGVRFAHLVLWQVHELKKAKKLIF